ncbi:MAG TPA: isocitrate lyase/phosphoenolpyruvate mutase family protein [Pyrinomonadaceae bacterium]|nr:isocitrate lyase/phosphoenolpyruvate mutase family protein [Pyrinomonadaceae bacterium]
MDRDGPIRLIEAHNGLAGIIGNVASGELNNEEVEFDGLWISSFTSAAAKGLPDAELNTGSRRIETIDEIMTVTDKPVLVDGDTGGDCVNFEYFCSKLETLGASGVVIEDKIVPKRNSLISDSCQLQEDPHIFAQKISRGREVLQSDDFLIFARIESFITNAGLENALFRARLYLLAGADGILIHSKQNHAGEIYAFLAGYEEMCRELGFRRPMAAVPTAYSVPGAELFEHGVKVIIYANHLLRAAHLAMDAVCKLILESDGTLEANALCSPLPAIFDRVGLSDVLRRDNGDLNRLKLLASGNGRNGDLFKTENADGADTSQAEGATVRITGLP